MLHTEALRERGIYSEVRCAFLKEEPYIDEGLLASTAAENICVIPDFLAEGYFTRKVIPQKLNLAGNKERVRYCPPIGTHPLMVDLIHAAAEAELGGWSAKKTSLLVIGHGSTKSPCSKQTLKIHIEELRSRGLWCQVADLWLEEPPKVAEWSDVASQKRVIIVPFLLNDGQHGGWDIPADLGIEEGATVHGLTHELDGREVRLTRALGTSPRFAEVIEAFAAIWSK